MLIRPSQLQRYSLIQGRKHEGVLYEFSAKQQREMANFKVLWRTWTHNGEFSFLYLNLNAVLTDSAPR